MEEDDRVQHTSFTCKEMNNKEDFQRVSGSLREAYNFQIRTQNPTASFWKAIASKDPRDKYERSIISSGQCVPPWLKSRGRPRYY